MNTDSITAAAGLVIERQAAVATKTLRDLAKGKKRSLTMYYERLRAAQENKK